MAVQWAGRPAWNTVGWVPPKGCGGVRCGVEGRWNLSVLFTGRQGLGTGGQPLRACPHPKRPRLSCWDRKPDLLGT